MLGTPAASPPTPHRGTDRQGPEVNGGPPVSRTSQGEAWLAGISPSARWGLHRQRPRRQGSELNGGAAQRWLVTSGQETAQGEAHEHRGSKANEMRPWRRKKGERRVGVHVAVFSGELGWNFGEQFPRRGSLPWEEEASADCARERRSSEQDGGWRWAKAAGTGNSDERTRAGGGGGSPTCALLSLARWGGKWDGVEEDGRGAAGVSERVGRGGHRAARCRRRRRMAATGRVPFAVVGRGEGRAACAGGPKGRRRPSNAKNCFFFYIFKSKFY
jgi:hypothetical protein